MIVIGDGAVGKTSLVKKYSQNTFSENYLPTIGSNFASKSMYINGVRINCQIWDLGGQPQFKIVRQNFYRGARGIVYVFDVTRRETFENLDKWREEVNEILSDPPCILIGNKIDLPRHVDEEEAKEYSLKINAQYFETSVAENINVQESIDRITHIIFEKQGGHRPPISPRVMASCESRLIDSTIKNFISPTSSRYPFSEDRFSLLFKPRTLHTLHE
ncbi:MAG: Rab family GTPase [Candidatus Freyarchaeota archaeon]